MGDLVVLLFVAFLFSLSVGIARGIDRLMEK